MLPHDRVRLQHMIDAAEAAVRFARGRTRTDLDTDQLLVFGLVRAVEVLGEAASRVSPAARSELPQVPWNQIFGMRNRLVHAYFDVDLTILWDTVTEAIPDLLTKIRAALAQLGGE
ncbi:DUF86 domain-containing protein [Myxococcota bacterium]